MKVRFSRKAEIDLEAIGDWISQDNPFVAIDLVQELRSECLNLSKFPDRHPIFLENGDEVIRRKIYGNYLIFYTIKECSLAIARIIHGARDYYDIF